MDASSTELQLTEWVQDWSESGAAVDATTDLRTSGILDSIGVVGLVARIEDLTGATFDLDTLTSPRPFVCAVCWRTAWPRDRRRSLPSGIDAADPGRADSRLGA